MRNGWKEETAETAEADSDKRIALKRKAEGDPSDSEVEDSSMNSLAELWHREDNPDGEVELLMAMTSRCVRSTRHLSHTMSADGITLTTRLESCSTTHLSRRQERRKFRSLVNLVSGRWLTDTVTRSCLVRAGWTSTKETNTNRSIAVDWSCKSTCVKQIGHFSQPLHSSRLLTQ